MREAAAQRSARRVVGPAALVKSLRGLLRRAHRFSQQRARGRDELIWAARFVDGLGAVLREADGGAATGQDDDRRAGGRPSAKLMPGSDWSGTE